MRKSAACARKQDDQPDKNQSPTPEIFLYSVLSHEIIIVDIYPDDQRFDFYFDLSDGMYVASF